MDLTICVRALDDGWSVQGDTVETLMVFRSGAEAEGAARTLAERHADAGRSTEVQVFLKDGSLAGRYLGLPGLGVR